MLRTSMQPSPIISMLWLLACRVRAIPTSSPADGCTANDPDPSTLLQTKIRFENNISKDVVAAGPCGFENSATPLCQTWTDMYNGNSPLDWIRGSSTSCPSTGPSGAYSGRYFLYLCIVKGCHRYLWAGLQSSSMTLGLGSRLQFHYFMFGVGVDKLQARFKESDGSYHTFFDKRGSQGQRWIFADIDISSYWGRTGVIQLIGGLKDDKGIIAIDELSLTPGSGTPAPTLAPTTTPTPPFPPSAGPCDFENSSGPLCQTWTVVKNTRHWIRCSKGLSSNGPKAAYSGRHFLCFNSNYQKGKTAILHSLPITFSAGARLQFHYSMYGFFIGMLKFEFLERDGSIHTLFEKHGHSTRYNQWRFADIDLSAYNGKTGVVQLVGKTSNKVQTGRMTYTIAIDELSLTPGSGTPAPTSAPPITPPSNAPTNAPTNPPTNAPTQPPTTPPTNAPTHAPTQSPTKPPTTHAPTPTNAPTQAPTNPPTQAPTNPPTNAPTQPPTNLPTNPPTSPPTHAPTLAPTQAPTNPPTLTSCGFESSAMPFCQTWTQMKNENLDWIRRSGQARATQNTGPGGAYLGTYYLYFDSDDAVYAGDMAGLQSPSMTFGVGARLKFHYHMLGHDVGMLAVWFKESQRSSRYLFQKQGGQGNRWNSADIDLSTLSGKTGVVELIARLGSSAGKPTTGDIAIDELSLTPGTLLTPGTPGTFSCSFETRSQPYCGTWENKKLDNFDWSRKSARTPSGLTGPNNAKEGSFYLFIEASSPRRSGDKAELGTNKAIALKPGAYLKFAYHMYGRSMGSLQVFVDSDVVFSKSGDQGKKWVAVTVPLDKYARKSVNIKFVGTRGSSYTGDAAIDDIVVFEG